MAGGAFPGGAEGGRVHEHDDYGGGITVTVVLMCLMAASCGLIFGYDVGVSGGVAQMESFMKKFFPEVLSGMKSARRDAYCKYDNHLLTTFTSSMFLAGMLSSLVAGHVTRRVGRRATMLIGGAMFLAGAAIGAGAVNVAMLIVGRMLIGSGMGFSAQAAPLYVAETSPARWRGALTTAYHFVVVAGTVAASVANYFTNSIPDWGWRVSLGLAGVPAAVIVVGALFIPDTPSSLVLRGEPDRPRASLQRVRGGGDVEAEFKDIVRAVEEARRNGESAYTRLRRKGYRHYLVMTVAIPVFFNLTGMIVVSVFSPLIFRTIGFSSEKAVLGSVILNLVSLSAVAASSFVVDRFGRRPLFLAGGVAMVTLQVAVSWILGEHLGKHDSAVATMPRSYATGVLVLICLCTFSYGMSWGPLKWEVPSEIFPVEVRSVAQGVTISIALAVSFAQTQVFITLLCSMKYATFLFYVGWILVMTAFVAALLPETKGVPLDAMRSVWERHWYWKRFAGDAKQGVEVNSLNRKTARRTAAGAKFDQPNAGPGSN